LQLSIHENPGNPSDVLEMYSFNFQYSNVESGNTQHRIDVTMQGPRHSKVSLVDARRALNDVILQLINLNGIMPALPARQTIMMHLVYNDRCPWDFKAEGFRRVSVQDQVRFPSQGWEMQTANMGQMHTG